MMYIIQDLHDERMYYKGLQELQGKEYEGYTCKKDNALKIKDKKEAESLANKLNGKVIEIK